MSHHAREYMVYPEVPIDKPWERIDEWINGFFFSRDYQEAMAKARMGVVNWHVPFVVQESPAGGIGPKESYYWVIGEE